LRWRDEGNRRRKKKRRLDSLHVSYREREARAERIRYGCGNALRLGGW
jgi:hypothetical protein